MSNNDFSDQAESAFNQGKEVASSSISKIKKEAGNAGFYRSTSDKMLSGVCGGLGEKFDINSTFIRLGVVILSIIFSGIPVIIYIAAWLLLPDDTQVAKGSLDSHSQAHYQQSQENRPPTQEPPMPSSGPYADVPGVDPMDSGVSTTSNPDITASSPSTPPPNHAPGDTPVINKDADRDFRDNN